MTIDGELYLLLTALHITTWFLNPLDKENLIMKKRHSSNTL
jgi:hypothetical protein